MKYKDFIIIGQGICGSIAGMELLAAGKKVMIINTPTGNPASLAAGAVLNPHKIWNPKPPDKALLAAFDNVIQYYKSLEKLLSCRFLFAKPLILLDETIKSTHASFQWGIRHTYHSTYFLDTQLLLAKFRSYFEAHNAYRAATFLPADLSRKEDLLYQWNDINSKSLLFCEGADGRHNPLWKEYTFNKNKGDALILHIPDLEESHIYQIGTTRLLPIGNHQFWLGTQHVWNFDSAKPDMEWKQQQIDLLAKALSVPHTIVTHLAAERPTTPGQKPILSFDIASQTGIINGMGSKGFTQSVLKIPAFIQSQCLHY